MHAAARNSLFLLLPLLIPPACVPYIHTAASSPHVTGRVVDVRSRAPLSGVTVTVEKRPGTAVKTDATGRFDLPEHKHLELWMVLGMCGSTGPNSPPYSESLEFTRTGYETRSVYANSLVEPEANDGIKRLKDVTLKRMPSLR